MRIDKSLSKVAGLGFVPGGGIATGFSLARRGELGTLPKGREGPGADPGLAAAWGPLFAPAFDLPTRGPEVSLAWIASCHGSVDQSFSPGEQRIESFCWAPCDRIGPRSGAPASGVQSSSVRIRTVRVCESAHHPHGCREMKQNGSLTDRPRPRLENPRSLVSSD